MSTVKRPEPVVVSRETEQKISTYLALLNKWQPKVNLVGPDTLTDARSRHFDDSAQVAPLLPQGTKTLTDLGSGAGFPGLVLAAMCPELDVTLIESDARKGAYLGEAARRMGLAKMPRIVIGRIEAVAPQQADVVTARALAPLGQLLAWAAPHRSAKAICLFHKGKGWQGELTEAGQDWEIEARPFSSVTDRDAVLLRIDAYRAKDLRDRQPEGRRG